MLSGFQYIIYAPAEMNEEQQRKKKIKSEF